VKRRLRIAAIAIVAGWAVSVPLRIEGYVLPIGVTLLLYAPLIIALPIAVRYRRTPLGIATLVAFGAIVCLRLFATPLVVWLAFQKRFDLLAPVAVCVPAVIAYLVRPTADIRPWTTVAGVAQAWWFGHTFTDFLYYTNESVPMTIAIACALAMVAVITPAAYWVRMLWSALEPALVVLIGWLGSWPFYKIHTQTMRIPDLEMQMFAVALPCAVLGVVVSLARRPNIPTS
jgi:hypothetical protein